MRSIDDINDLGDADFVTSLSGIYESSSWVPEAVCEGRPFASRERLAKALRMVVESASEADQLALIRAHPDLGGNLARAGELTDESTREQHRLGLDQLSEEEYGEFTDLNSAYRKRFDFPFIICVGQLASRDDVLRAFRERLRHSPEEERIEALQQIHCIASLRLTELIR